MADRPNDNDTARLVERARKLRDLYADRDSDLDLAEQHYYDTGVVKEAAGDDGAEIYRVRVPDGQTFVDVVADLLSAQDVTVSVPATKETNKEQQRVDAIERWLRAWLDTSQRNEDVDLVRECAWDAVVRGAIVVRVMVLPERINPDDADENDGQRAYRRFPLVPEIRDWRCVYPVYKRTRVEEVFECYNVIVGDLRRDHEDLDIPPSWRDTDQVEMWEWWDCDKKAFWVQGVGQGDAAGVRWLMEPTEHNLGCLPYTVRTVRGSSKRRGDPAKLAPSILQTLIGTLDAMSEVESAMYTAALGYVNSAWAMTTDDPEAKLDLSHGAVNMLRVGEEAKPLVKAEMPLDLQAVASAWQQRFQRASLPAVLYGEGISAQVAGYAIALQTEQGRRILLPVIRAITNAIADACANALRICAAMLGDTADGFGFSLELPYAQAKEGRRIIQRAGLDYGTLKDLPLVDVQLGDPLPADEERNMGLAQMARSPGPTGTPLLSDRTIREKHLHVADDTEEKTRIYAEQFETQARDLIAKELGVEAGLLPPDEAQGMEGQPAQGMPPEGAPPPQGGELQQVLAVVEQLAQEVARLKQAAGMNGAQPPMAPMAPMAPMPEQMPAEMMPEGAPMMPPMPPDMMPMTA